MRSVRIRRLVRASLALVGAWLIIAPSAATASGPEIVTGSGHITRGGENRTFEFSAKKAADGSARGTANLHARNVGWHLNIDINCVRIVGNVAYLSGLVTDSVPDFIEGAQARFAVVDNGEGSPSPD